MSEERLNPDDHRAQALASFKEWSNYLLVTTVAAVGWIATQTADPSAVRQQSTFWFNASVWCLALSAVCGIFTLALVPLVYQQLEPHHESIYKVQTTFHAFGIEWHPYLTQMCRPQHILFIFGVLFYAYASAPAWLMAVSIGFAAAAIGYLSSPCWHNRGKE